MIALHAGGCIFRSERSSAISSTLKTFRTVVLSFAAAFLTLVLAARCSGDDTVRASAAPAAAASETLSSTP